MPDLSALLKGVRDVVGPLAGSGGALTTLATAIVPVAPRRRAAVLAHDGYATLEAYQRARPLLFYGSAAVAVGATGMAWWRRRQGFEAVGGWGTVAALAGLLAYLTRPAAGTGQAVDGPSAKERAYQWLDARAAYLDRTEPGWEDRVTAQVVGAVGA